MKVVAFVELCSLVWFVWTSFHFRLLGTTKIHPVNIVMRDPVAVNHTQLRLSLSLDNSGRLYELRTLSMDPPIFEIEDFLTPEECSTIINLGQEAGLFKSDHTFLDGSNYGQKDMNTSGLTKQQAENLFRYSDQTWLRHTSHLQLQDMMQRLQKLALLPNRVLSQIEQLQVVKYNKWGHYESHWDSEPDHLGPCCIDPVARGMETGVRALKKPLEKRCRLCRFMTVLYYLVDTEEGGETIFPLADTTDEELAAWETSTHELKYKQTRACAPGTKVSPKKGKAVMWYNHHVDRGYLGPRYVRSLHGGCNVVKGEKWIANHWISDLPHPDTPRTAATGHV